MVRETPRHAGRLLRPASCACACLLAAGLAAAAPVGEGPFDRDGIIRLLHRVNDWQAAHPVMKPDDRNWERGTWYAGVMAAYTATGDERFLGQAELFDKEDGLFYRDLRFIGQRTKNGRKVFWSRGNGWVLGGIVRVLEYLPADDPQRPRYVELLRTMSAAIAKRQGADGLWRPNLDDPEDVAAPESSGTGFFCYGMAWGIRHGLLDRDAYLPVVRKAWAGLVKGVSPEGKVQWGQPVGDRPATVKEELTHEYVTGTFLLAGSEMLELAQAAGIGLFDEATDVGKIELKGASAYLADQGLYRITGSGKNIWAETDAFQFLWKKASGDLVFTMEAGWEGEGKEPHRKACAMVRAGLEADAPYVDVAVHGDGLIEFQFRKAKGGVTGGARAPVKAPATVKLERDGDVFTASVSKGGGAFQPVGAVSLALPDPVWVGLAVSAHNATNLETAVITNVTLRTPSAAADGKRVRESSLETLSIESGERKLIYRDCSLFEAPNWSRDGKLFYYNRAGGIWTVPVEGGEPKQLDTGAAAKCNNDHGLSFDGKWLAISSGGGKEGSKIHIVPAAGGTPREVTPTGPSYWHGWSPDGSTLVYCAQRNGEFDVYAIPAAGGAEKRLTDAAGLDDGPEYTADGSKIYFLSERTGVPKIWRMNPDGSGQEQVTSDEDYADWFPHPSPDGKWIVFLSFDKSVKGHPADQNVVLRLMPMAGGKPKVIATLFGGQGTLNVPSWSPDSTRIAFVSYRHVLASSGKGALK